MIFWLLVKVWLAALALILVLVGVPAVIHLVLVWATMPKRVRVARRAKEARWREVCAKFQEEVRALNMGCLVADDAPRKILGQREWGKFK